MRKYYIGQESVPEVNEPATPNELERNVIEDSPTALGLGKADEPASSSFNRQLQQVQSQGEQQHHAQVAHHLQNLAH